MARRNLDECGDQIAAALRHHEAVARAYDREDDAAFDRAHDHLGRALRQARRALNAAKGDTGAGEVDLAGNGGGNSQNSGGMTQGTSAGRGSPLLVGNIGGWLDRARVGAWGRR